MQTYAALVDYSNQTKWIQQKATIPHPTEFPMLLGNHMGYERIISDRARRNYAISVNELRDPNIQRERETINLKMNQDKNSPDLDTYKSNEKKNLKKSTVDTIINN